MEHVSKRVCVNLLDTSEDDSVLHHPLPVDAILRRAKPLRVDRRFHGRSRLLLYG
jgi:hypothetical protein